MADITTIRPRQNKTVIGGIAAVYVFKYAPVALSAIEYDGNRLTSFPATTVYQIDGENLNVTQTTRRENGTVVYDQSLQMDINGPVVADEIHNLNFRDYRVIYRDRIGNYRILGLFNGCIADVNENTGTEKSEANAYNVTFNGVEPFAAKWINDLSDVGFTIFDLNNKVFQSGCNAITQAGDNLIFQ